MASSPASLDDIDDSPSIDQDSDDEVIKKLQKKLSDAKKRLELHQKKEQRAELRRRLEKELLDLESGSLSSDPTKGHCFESPS